MPGQALAGQLHVCTGVLLMQGTQLADGRLAGSEVQMLGKERAVKVVVPGVLQVVLHIADAADDHHQLRLIQKRNARNGLLQRAGAGKPQVQEAVGRLGAQIGRDRGRIPGAAPAEQEGVAEREGAARTRKPGPAVNDAMGIVGDAVAIGVRADSAGVHARPQRAVDIGRQHIVGARIGDDMRHGRQQLAPPAAQAAVAGGVVPRGRIGAHGRACAWRLARAEGALMPSCAGGRSPRRSSLPLAVRGSAATMRKRCGTL